MTYHHSDEIADLSDAMRSAQEWQEIAEALYLALKHAVEYEDAGWEARCPICGFWPDSHDADCQAKIALECFEKKNKPA